MNEFSLPEEWKIVRLTEVATIQTGLAKGKTGLQNPVRLPYLRVANVQDGYLDLSDIKAIEVESADIERYTLQEDDVLLTEGGDNDKLGRGHVWQGQIPICLHQNHIFVVRTDRERLDPYFFSFLTNSTYGKLYFRKSAKQSTNLATINSTQLKHFPVILPPKQEQLAIKKVLQTWDRAIALTEQRLAAAEQRKKALMQKLLTGQVRFPEFAGEEWQEVRIGKIVVTRNEQSPQTDKLELYSLTIESGVTPKTERYDREFLVRQEDKKYKMVYPGDIVYNPSNLRWGAINISHIDKVVLVSPIYEVLYNRNPNQYDASFIAHRLMWDRQIQLFTRWAEGTLVERMAVKLRDFLSVHIFLPKNVAEQRRIAAVLDACGREIDLLRRKRDALQQQKKGLMQRLLTGRVRVKI